MFNQKNLSLIVAISWPILEHVEGGSCAIMGYYECGNLTISCHLSYLAITNPSSSPTRLNNLFGKHF